MSTAPRVHWSPELAAALRRSRGNRRLALVVLLLLVTITMAVSPGPQPQLAPLVLLASLFAGISAKRQFSLARRAEIGARSEQFAYAQVQPLEAEGWRIERNVDWPGNGDLDLVAIAPGGPAFVTDVKTCSYTAGHLRRASRAAAMFTDCVPMIATLAPRMTTREADVTVCSIDKLSPQLCAIQAEYQRLLVHQDRAAPHL